MSASNGVAALAAAAAVLGGSSSPSPGDLDLWRDQSSAASWADKDLQVLCQKLSLDPATVQGAWELLSRVYQRVGRNERDMKTKWMQACTVWIAGRLNAVSSRANGKATLMPNGVSLNQLMVHTEVQPQSMEAFSEHMQVFVSRNERYLTAEQRDVVAAQLDGLLQTYTVACTVFKRYKEVFSTIFAGTVFGTKIIGDAFKFCWLLFLLTQETVLGDNKNSANHFVLLLCAIKLAACQEQHKLPLQPEVKARTAKCDGARSVSAVIQRFFVDKFGVSDAEYVEAERSFMRCLQQLLSGKKLNLNYQYRGSEGEWLLFNVQGLLVDSFGYFEANLNELNNAYEHKLRAWSGDHDMRVLVNGRYHVGVETPRKAAGTPRTTAMSPAARDLTPMFDRVAAAYHPMAATPLTARTMQISTQSMQRSDLPARFQEVYGAMSDQPSPALTAIFSQCMPNPEQAIRHRVTTLLQYLHERASRAATHFSLVPRIYYSVLDATLAREQKRLLTTDFSAMLNDASYHKALLCCAVEVVLFSAQIREVPFETLLDHVDLRPFHCLLVIESFIREEQLRLGKDVVKRFKEIEERILESEAWKDDDPIYQLLRQEEDSNAAAVMSSPQPSTATVMSSPRKALQAVSQPGSVRLSQAADAAAASDSAIKRDFRSSQLQFFYRKLFRLVHVRLMQLCEKLVVPHELTQKTWDMLVELLSREGRLRLLYKRHMDTIIMCTIYSVSKMQTQASNASVKFKDIIAKYNEQPQSQRSVYMTITVEDRRPSAAPMDIVNFYNSIFLNDVMAVIGRLSDGATVAAAIPPAPVPQTSPTRVSARSRLFVAEHSRAPEFGPPSSMTPRSRTYYCFGESLSPQKDFQQLNQLVAKSSKRLMFDGADTSASSSQDTHNKRPRQDDDDESPDSES